MKQWNIDSWREMPVIQLPEYPDKAHLQQVENRLRKMPPLVFAGEVRELRRRLAQATEGNDLPAAGRRLC
ncbi:3-deoxy-D-arabino-heptulosonate 7-phosphate (DAHP) synthase class II [Endozoicomonas sp. NE43]